MPQNPEQTTDPYTAWLDSLSEGLTETTPTGGVKYRGLLTPLPESWLPDWVKLGYNNSIEGLSRQILTGESAYEVTENYTPDMWGDLGATIISLIQPGDAASLVLGGGIGGAAFKASAKTAAKAMMKSGIKKDLAEMSAAKGAQMLAKKVALDKKAVMKYAATKQAGALGFYAGLQTAEVTKLTEGDINWMETLEATTKGGILGGITGGIGGKISTTALSGAQKTALRLPSETFAFGTVSPILEGKAPTANDYVHAAGVIIPLAGIGALKKKAINQPWGKFKKYVKGEVKKRKLTGEELTRQSELQAKQEIGKDIWSNGEKDVVITKDFTNSDKVNVLELRDIKTGEILQEGKSDFFLGRRNDTGNRISKPFQRLTVAGEPVKYGGKDSPSDVKKIFKGKIYKLAKELNVSDVELKNMVDDLLGKTQKVEYDGKRMRSGMRKEEFDTQLHHRLLNDLTVKSRIEPIKKEIGKLGGNEVYYEVNKFKTDWPKVYKALQRVGAGLQSAQFQLQKHPVGRQMAKLMINTDASIGALTGKYLELIKNVEIGKTKFGKSKKFFKMTEAEAYELAKDLERPNPRLPHTREIRKLFDIMYAIAEQSGMPVRDKIPYYFPHVVKEGVLRNLQKDVDNMINLEKVLAKSNLSGEKGINVLIERMVRSGELTGDLTPDTISALKHLRGTLGSYSSAFERLRTGINSERYTLNKHLEKGRELDLPDTLLERDARVVIPDYIQRWAKRVEYVKAFGAEGERMFGNINLLQGSGFSNEARVLRDTFDSFTNLSETNPARNYRPSTKSFWNAMVNYGIGTKIGGGFASLPNLGQPFISSMLKAGIPRTIFGYFKYLKYSPFHDPKYRKFINESGAMATSLSVHQLIAGYQPSSLTLGGKFAEFMTGKFGVTIPYPTLEGSSLKIRAKPLVTFQTINRHNQLISAISGYEAMQVWRKWAKGQGAGGKVDVIPGISNRLRSVENLNQMGLIENYEQHKRDLTNGKITEREFFKRVNRELDKELASEAKEREAIYRFAIDSQLQRNILREPVYFNDPRFRPFILFKRFGYRQFEWIYKNTLQEVKAGNALFVLRMMAGGMMYGPMLNSAKRMLRDVLAGQPVFDESYTVTEQTEDYEAIINEMKEKGLSVSNFLDSAVKNISMGDLLDSFAAIGAYGFVGDLSSAIYEGEQKMIRAGEFLLKPAVLQDMMVGVDTATRFLLDYGDYGFKNSIARVPKTLSPAFGTITRQAMRRLWTPGQEETYTKYRRGIIKSEMLEAVLDGDDERALRLLTAWNRANPDTPFSYNDISWKAMWEKAKRKAEKRINP